MGVPFLMAALKILPVEIVGIQSFLLIISDCVPFPEPGRLKDQFHWRLLFKESLIMAHKHLRLYLLDGFQYHADDDDDRCPQLDPLGRRFL